MATNDSNVGLLPTPKHTFLELLRSLRHIALDEAGTIINQKDDIDCIIEMARAVRVRLCGAVASVSLTLFYAQDVTPKNDRDHDVHWIMHSIGEAIRDLDKFVVGLSCTPSRKWPSEAASHRPQNFFSILIALPFLQTKTNRPMLSLLEQSAANAVYSESTNVRVFSEQLMVAQPTGEIDSELNGALAYIAEWSGLIEELVSIRNDANFELSNTAPKAA